MAEYQVDGFEGDVAEICCGTYFYDDTTSSAYATVLRGDVSNEMKSRGKADVDSNGQVNYEETVKMEVAK